ncbi:imidazolonepropionase [Aquimarina brevivitae]|uniref:Imidazolonepropionase n=1 Tax=Aquimarina brevivitae TaxID=323412 RepID=A0A4Q7NU24_9FLAO|nr:imidazolonepropionase [Aquimarina brevivitae]RZS90681.1 imidazolonepropionase [Aquimarina brevivitae]
MSQEHSYKLIGPITQLISMEGLPVKGALKDEELPIIQDAGILLQDEKVIAVGSHRELLKKAQRLKAQLIELKGKYVATPGFIDCHTHICFAGSRAKDYAMRNAGKSYLEIAKAGGGIWDTVTKTREASLEQLFHNTMKRANQMIKNGITTIEVKSGYGLSIEEELKMLRAIALANRNIEADLISTCLAAHMLPKDFNGSESAYLEWISKELFPVLKQEKLTNRIDAFIEESAFSTADIIPYYSKAIEMGFNLTVHADQFTTGGSQVAAEMGALSADHLEVSTDTEIAILAASNTIAVALPGASLGLGCAFTPARKILDQGGALAIASDWNPGSAPMGDLLTQASILGTFQKLSNAELLAGITYRAAAALDLTDRGTIASGKLADINLFATDDNNEIWYHQGKLTPAQVWKNGELIFTEH